MTVKPLIMEEITFKFAGAITWWEWKLGAGVRWTEGARILELSMWLGPVALLVLWERKEIL